MDSGERTNLPPTEEIVTPVAKAFHIGQWREDKSPTSILESFGSLTLKATIFIVREGHQGAVRIKAISSRDAFPQA